MVVRKTEKRTASTGRDMITVMTRVVEGENKGRKLVENFVLPSDSSDSPFGLQRFHAFLIACGSKEIKGKKKLDLDTLVGLKIIAEVDDETQPATDKYPERIVSRALAYHPATKKAVAALEDDDDDEEEEEEEEDEEEEEEEEEEEDEEDEDDDDDEEDDDEPAAADDEDDLFDGLDEDEEEKPKKKKGAKKGKPSKKSKKKGK
jgi:hypothetical protein